MTNDYNILNHDYSNLKTFVINLNDYKKNYLNQLPYLNTIGLNVERFSGINALKDEHLNLKYKQYISKFAYNLTPKSIIGCALSHILCCKHIYDNYINLEDNNNNIVSGAISPLFFLIMEDDAFPKYLKTEFYEKLDKTLYEIQLLDPDWEIIQLHSDCIIPTNDTYNTHLACGSAAAYLISKKGIIKTINSKIYSHLDFIQHNFIKYNKYRAKNNLFYTNEKDSLNRIQLKNKNYKYYSLLIKSKFLEYLNNYTNIIPLRGEKKYQHFLEFKLIKDPLFNKEYNANDLIDYFFGFILFKKFIKHTI